MPTCPIPYIPQHLHQNNKPLIAGFHNTEEVYWRLGVHPTETPFKNISLRDVSVNRSGEKNSISQREDVLWNTEPDKNDFEKYESNIVTVTIRKIFEKGPETKIINDDPVTTGRSATMKLIHDPLPCNYAHSMFVFDVDGVRINRENYDQLFNIKPFKKIRQACRDILHKAVVKGEILFNTEPPV